MQEVSMVQRRDRRQRQTPEFKCQAVQLMHERIAAGATLQRVSDELDVSPDLLRVWSKQVAAAPAHATAVEIFPGHGKRRLTKWQPRGQPATFVRSPEQELARLQREVERLRRRRFMTNSAGRRCHLSRDGPRVALPGRDSGSRLAAHRGLVCGRAAGSNAHAPSPADGAAAATTKRWCAASFGSRRPIRQQ